MTIAPARPHGWAGAFVVSGCHLRPAIIDHLAGRDDADLHLPAPAQLVPDVHVDLAVPSWVARTGSVDRGLSVSSRSAGIDKGDQKAALQASQAIESVDVSCDQPEMGKPISVLTARLAEIVQSCGQNAGRP